MKKFKASLHINLIQININDNQINIADTNITKRIFEIRYLKKDVKRQIWILRKDLIIILINLTKKQMILR